MGELGRVGWLSVRRGESARTQGAPDEEASVVCDPLWRDERRIVPGGGQLYARVTVSQVAARRPWKWSVRIARSVNWRSISRPDVRPARSSVGSFSHGLQSVLGAPI